MRNKTSQGNDSWCRGGRGFNIFGKIVSPQDKPLSSDNGIILISTTLFPSRPSPLKDTRDLSGDRSRDETD